MIDISHALTVSGWMAESELMTLAALSQSCNVIVEVGSWEGRSACAMAANSPAFIFCVDAWQGHLQGGHEATWETLARFKENTARYSGRVIPVLAESHQAVYALSVAGIVPDMVFIDASHDYQSVTLDIIEWTALLRPGAIAAGHDYGDLNWPGVKQAVDELLPGVMVSDSIWWKRL